MEEKTPLSHEVVCFQMLGFGTPKSNSNNLVENNFFFLENYATSEGAVSHNVLYYQPLPITRYQVFWVMPNSVHYAFKYFQR